MKGFAVLHKIQSAANDMSMFTLKYITKKTCYIYSYTEHNSYYISIYSFQI
jgi:hypothetical protein